MKMHLWLIALACILVFGCNGEKRLRTLEVPEAKKCHGASCKMIITLDLKEKIDTEKKVEVRKNQGNPGESPKIGKVKNLNDPIDPNYPNGPKEHPIGETVQAGVILRTISSPDCIYFFYDGYWWYICDEP